MTGPLSSGDFDPLTPPGSSRQVSLAAAGGFTQGQFVRAAMNDTAFFLKRPRGDADADKLLKFNTPMKVIANDDAYVKVELDSGEVGFVPSVMLTDPNAPAAGLPGAPGEIQVYPPLTPITPVDNTLPVVPPSEVPPGGAIPSVVDPAAPPVDVPVPSPSEPVAPTTPPAETPKPATEKPATEKPATEEPKPAGN
jgi:hypothetical protein